MEKLLQVIDDADVVIVFSGPGVSKESGLKAMNTDIGGFRVPRPSSVLHTIMRISSFWDYAPRLLWRPLLEYFFRHPFLDSDPGHCHNFVGMLSKRKEVVVVTQNIDGLHRTGGVGSTNIFEVNGNALEVVCTNCHSEKHNDGDMALLECECGSHMRPGCRMRDEKVKASLLEEFMDRMSAIRAVQLKAVALLVGLEDKDEAVETMLASALTICGMNAFEVNPEDTYYSSLVTEHVRVDIGDFFCDMMDAYDAKQKKKADPDHLIA